MSGIATWLNFATRLTTQGSVCNPGVEGWQGSCSVAKFSHWHPPNGDDQSDGTSVTSSKHFLNILDRLHRQSNSVGKKARFPTWDLEDRGVSRAFKVSNLAPHNQLSQREMRTSDYF